MFLADMGRLREALDIRSKGQDRYISIEDSLTAWNVVDRDQAFRTGFRSKLSIVTTR